MTKDSEYLQPGWDKTDDLDLKKFDAELAADLGEDLNGNKISIADKFAQLEKKIVALFDNRVWHMVKAALCVHTCAMFKDAPNPIGLIFVDGPSSEKTTVLDMFTGMRCNHHVDKFTPASFVTQSPNVKTEEQRKKVDLLPHLPYRTLIVPEMGPTFNQPKEILNESFGDLTVIFDGKGFVRRGGVFGERGYRGDYIFGFLGATTPISQTAWNAMGKLGARLVMWNAPAKRGRAARRQRSFDTIRTGFNYKERKRLAKEAVADYMRFFFAKTEPIGGYEIPVDVPKGLETVALLKAHCGYLPRSLMWDVKNDDEEAHEMIADLCEFTTAARSDIRVWSEKNDEGNFETSSTGKTEEGVERFTSLAYNFARCHALISGRDHVEMADVEPIVTLAISSIPDERRLVIEAMIRLSDDEAATPGKITSEQAAHALSTSSRIATTVLRKLELLELGSVDNTLRNKHLWFQLDEAYDWLFEERFKQFYRPWAKRHKVQNDAETGVPF